MCVRVCACARSISSFVVLCKCARAQHTHAHTQDTTRTHTQDTHTQGTRTTHKHTTHTHTHKTHTHTQCVVVTNTATLSPKKTTFEVGFINYGWNVTSALKRRNGPGKKGILSADIRVRRRNCRVVRVCLIFRTPLNLPITCMCVLCVCVVHVCCVCGVPFFISSRPAQAVYTRHMHP